MIDGKPRIGDEVYIHGYIDEIRNDVVIIRNEGGYFGTSDREIFYYEEDERGYGTMNEADRKTENCSEKPNNSTISKMEQVDEPSGYKTKPVEDEPQTEREIAKAIVHKMIDDAVIAEDAYPDLRQKMHDAVDEYEPQTERSE